MGEQVEVTERSVFPRRFLMDIEGLNGICRTQKGLILVADYFVVRSFQYVCAFSSPKALLKVIANERCYHHKPGLGQPTSSS